MRLARTSIGFLKSRKSTIPRIAFGETRTLHPDRAFHPCSVQSVAQRGSTLQLETQQMTRLKRLPQSALTNSLAVCLTRFKGTVKLTGNGHRAAVPASGDGEVLNSDKPSKWIAPWLPARCPGSLMTIREIRPSLPRRFYSF